MLRRTVIAVFVATALGWSTAAGASTIFLIGSDVIGLHGDTEFVNPVMDQIGNFSGTTGNKVLFVNDYGRSSLAAYSAGNVTIDFAAASSITSGTDLSAYQGIYIDSPGSCCGDPASIMTGAGAAAALSAYFAGGGNIAVGNYWGDPFWDTAFGFSSSAAGITSGVGTILCEDPGLSTASGLAFGFKPSYTEGCFVHQTYDPAFWTGRGFFALQTDGALTSRNGDFVTMATGFTEPGTVPEPATLLLLGSGLGAAALRRRRTTR